MKKLLTIIMTALTVFSASGVQAGTETVITPSISFPRDHFGVKVDMAENVAIVSTSGENGAAFIYENEPNGWNQKAILTESNDSGLLGSLVAISESFAVVGSHDEKVYVFQKPVNGWTDMNATQVLSLYHPEYEKVTIIDLAIHGNTLVVCLYAYFQDEMISPVHIYDYNGSEWVLSETIISENNGGRADIYGDYIIIGISSGKFGTLIYKRNENGKWVQNAKLIPDDMEDLGCFGRDVAISEGVAFVGNNCLSSAYIFAYDGTQWVQKQKFTEYDALGLAAYYGTSLDITKDYAVVGSFGYREDNGLIFCGAAFLYKRNGNSDYVKIGKYLAPNPQLLGAFGASVALSDRHFIVGDPYNDLILTDGSTGIDSGSAVIYNLPGDLDGDGCVGKNDAAILRTFLNHPASECPECDLDEDDRITILDARKLVGFCTNANCECP